MDHTEASNRLKALASSSPSRSLSARLNDLMPDIDHAMQNGVPRTEILKALSEAGIELKMGYFNIVRYRFKSKQLKQDQLQGKNGLKSIPQPIESTEIMAKQERFKNTLKIIDPEKIGIADSVIPASASARRFRNQFVDLDAYSELAPKKS